MPVPNLNELTELFKQSASNEKLPSSERAFAAQCALLAGHLRRVERKHDALIGELAGIIEARTGEPGERVVGTPGTPPSVPAQVSTAPQAAVEPVQEEATEDDLIDDEIAKASAKNAADLAAKVASAQARAAKKTGPTESAS